MKKRAFTLAEILISMTIIGIVSLLMIPVIQNVQERSLEVATQHFHSMMSQAIKHYMVDQNALSLANTKMSAKETEDDELIAAAKAVDDFMYQYLSVAKVCSYEDRFDCFNKEIKNLDNKRGKLELHSYYGLIKKELKVYVLENGNVIYLAPCSNYSPATIQVDVNGKKKPNIVGRDIWAMDIYADGVLSEHLHEYMMREYLRSNPTEMKRQRNSELEWQTEKCTTDGLWQYAAGCFARFENNGFKFDY